ncbi:MAG TPA: AraC family transcriptional regulator [Puia sp.]|nr:AraC family transcriptional regulator [Puia sp.]
MGIIMPDDQYRISEFKKALRRNAIEGVVDLDKNYLHKFNVQIHRLEDVLRNSKRNEPPNRWSYHRIGLISEGETNVKTGIFSFKAKKNTLVVVPSRVISSSSNWAPGTRGYVLLFNMDFFLENNFSRQIIGNKRMLTPFVRPYVQLTDEQAEEVSRIFESILVEKKQNGLVNNELIAVKIVELLILGERLFEQGQNMEANEPLIDSIKRFVDMLDEYFAREHSVKFYAEQLAIHPNHLNALVKKHTGLSAKESIQNKILLEIKHLLHSTKLSIKQISDLMGFKDPNYFTTFFKRAEKLSPGSYRASFD